MSLLGFGQIVVSLLLIVAVLLQERESGVSGVLGGGQGGEFYHRRRGIEKFVFVATILLLIVFVALALVNLVL